jgi:hypothetical protein
MSFQRNILVPSSKLKCVQSSSIRPRDCQVSETSRLQFENWPPCSSANLYQRYKCWCEGKPSNLTAKSCQQNEPRGNGLVRMLLPRHRRRTGAVATQDTYKCCRGTEYTYRCCLGTGYTYRCCLDTGHVQLLSRHRIYVQALSRHRIYVQVLSRHRTRTIAVAAQDIRTGAAAAKHQVGEHSTQNTRYTTDDRRRQYTCQWSKTVWLLPGRRSTIDLSVSSHGRSSMVGYSVQLQKSNVLSTKFKYTDHIIRLRLRFSSIATALTKMQRIPKQVTELSHLTELAQLLC